MSEAVRTIIIGAGIMGSHHIRDVTSLENCELIGICDNDEAVLDKFDKEYDVPKYANYLDALDADNLDAIIISTPHYDHTPISIAALERGIHVLVEKPIAVHVNDARKMISAYEKALETYPNLKFSAMFMQRTYGQWRKIKEMIDSGDLGDLIRTTWLITDWFRTQYYYDMGGWRASWEHEGGGVLMNQSPHNLDLYQWLVGMPSQVRGFAKFGKHHKIEVEDEVTGYFEHANGMIGHFITTTAESPGTNRLEIVGENGKLVYEDNELVFYRNAHSSKKQIAEAQAGFEKVKFEKEAINFDHHGQAGHRFIIENFVDAIRDESVTLMAPAIEGINSVMLANAIILSSYQKETVDLPLDGNAFEALLNNFIASPPTS